MGGIDGRILSPNESGSQREPVGEGKLSVCKLGELYIHPQQKKIQDAW